MSKREQYNSLRCCLFAQVKHNAHCGEGQFEKEKKCKLVLLLKHYGTKNCLETGKVGRKNANKTENWN